MTFKKLVERITEIKTAEDFNEICGQVDRSFEAGKITWNDHETLFKLLNLLNRF